MSAFGHFRWIFRFQRIQFRRLIPLLKRTQPVRSTTSLALLWLVRAQTRVEYANETNRPNNLREIVDRLDNFFDKEQFQEAFDFINENKTNPLFQSFYIQWRVGRIFYKLSLTSDDKKFKRKLIEDGLAQAKLSLEKGNHISSVHKWYGILLNAASEFLGVNEQIRCAYEVLDHFEEACRLNPQDPTAHHCLGSWFWEVSQIPAWKKRVVSLVFSELPRGTVNDALKKFVLAEEISPGFYSKNLLMIIKCYIALNGKTQAKEFSKILMNRQRKTKEDEEVHQELLKLIPKIEALVPFVTQV